MNKMYVLVRKDIPRSWYAPQACHAVAQYCLDYGMKEWPNGHIVILGADDEDHLEKHVGILNNEGIYNSTFIEEYIDEYTSVAFVCDHEDLGLKPFKQLDLL